MHSGCAIDCNAAHIHQHHTNLVSQAATAWLNSGKAVIQHLGLSEKKWFLCFRFRSGSAETGGKTSHWLLTLSL